MSIKIYNEVTGEWEVKATNQATLTEVDDVTGELDAEDVEEALTNLVDKIEDIELDMYNVDKQLTRTNDKIDALINDFQHHLDNHPSGGGGDGVMPTITSTFEDNTVVDKGEKVYIPIFFSSGNLGNGNAYILVNNVEIGMQNVKQGSNTIEVGVMPKQLNTVSIYVKDRGGRLSNQLSWTIICGGIEVSTTFDFEADYPMGEKIVIPFNIETQSTEKIIMYLTIDQDVKMIDCVNGYNEYTLPELGVGIHKISYYVESGRYLTDTYNYNLVIVDSNNLYVSTTWMTGQEVAFGRPININYRISKASTENFTINLYLDEKLEKTQTAPAGSYYWTLPRLPIGEHQIKIEATGVQGDYAFVETSVIVIEGVYTPLEPVTGGLLAYFNAKNKTNQDDGKETWVDESGNGVVATLHNFNYGNNGWMGDYLQCSGDAYVEIDMQPYLNNVKQGSTIDIHFNMTSVGVEEARVLDYTEVENPQKGIYINTLETKLVSETSTGLVKLDEDTDTRLTYVIDRTNGLAIIYLNGVINRVFKLSDSGTGTNATFEDFSHKEKIFLNSRKGEDLFADCKIYSLRVYGRALSHEEVLQNHIADITDLNEQEKAYNRNYANTEIPEVRMYGDTTNMTGEIFQTMRIKYTSPNEELYGQSFDTLYNQVRWQGTSSQQYNMKNYQVYLKDNNMADMYYSPFPNGVKEHIFCFKCNYMESSHMNNTGIATFANDCIFTTPNPAQAKDPRVRNSINGFPVLMYINDELEGVYTFNLDRYSTNSLGYNTSQFPNCLSYEISANSDTGAGAFVPWNMGTGKTEREYISADFRCRFPDNRVNGDDDFAELKRLIDWVGNATDDMFREQIEQYFDLEYLIRYYLTVMCFGLVDNLGKNTMLTTFDGQKWYLQLYDCDSCTGLDNSGAMKFEPDIEVQVGVFNTSNSRLWEKLRNNFPSEILAQWELLRLNEFTEENIMKYLSGNISAKIPEINYNLDAWKKYINLGTEYLFACHGNRKQQITRWIRERLIYMDTLLGYTVSTNDYITVRANKLGEVYFDIQTFQPMYFSIKFRNEENNTGVITKRIGRGETVRFSYNLPVATDQEILVYGGRFIKDLGDLTNLNPTNLLLGNATRLTRVKCNNSNMLINASISNCTMLQEVDLRGCSNLGAGSDASLQTLDLTQCRNLRTVDIFGTQLTALYTSQVGGIIQEIIYPYSIQIVQVKNQARLTSLGIPCYYTGNYNDARNTFAERLTLVDVANCPNVTTFVKNYCTNEDGSEIPVPTFVGVSKGRTFNLSNTMSSLTQIDLSYCSNIESLTLDNFNNLVEMNFDDIAQWNATTSNLHNVKLTNCPNVKTITFNQNTIDGDNSLGVAFKQGTVLDLSGLYNLEHIRSNVGVKGLSKLILPLTVKSVVFDRPHDTTYSLGDSDILDIFSRIAVHENDLFHGIDLIGIDTITDFSMGSLTKMNNAINLNVKITNTFPYFNYFKTEDYFKPEGTVDISEYTGSLEYLFKGVDLDKLTVVCRTPLPHTSGRYMFAFASGQDVNTLNTLFSYMPNVTDFSYMFYNGFLKYAPLIPTRAENVSYMFYNNITMETTPSNWNQAYTNTPISDYCYTGCSNIVQIDNSEGSIDIIPVAWGGYDRKNTPINGEAIDADRTLEREFVNFTASGQTYQNIVPEVGQTPTILANKSEQPICEGMASNIMVADGTMAQAELKGFTLVNLASEKRSGELTCNKQDNNIRNGLASTFKVEDGGAFPHAMLEGLSLANILSSDGKTPIITNGDKQSHRIDDKLDNNIKIKDGKMLSATVYGKTLENAILEDYTSPLYTNDYQETTNICNGDTTVQLKDTGKIKSAILTGQTLVNLFQDMDYVWNNLTKQDSFNYNGDLIILNNGYRDGRNWNLVPKIPNIKSNTEYTMIFTKGSSPYVEFGTVDENGQTSSLKKIINAQKVKITSPDNGDLRVKFCIENPTSDKSAINLGKVMFIEGDYTNVDIPYFEGMQSVKNYQTLVNLFDFKEPITVMTDRIRLSSSDDYKNRITNGVYTIINTSDKKISLDICNKSNDAWIKTVTLLANRKTTIEFTDTYIRLVSFMFSDGWSSGLEDKTKNTVMVLKGVYTNQDTPYFKDSKLVQHPILTTTGENLFDIKKCSNSLINSDSFVIIYGTGTLLEPFIKIKQGQKVSISKENITWIAFLLYDENKNPVKMLNYVYYAKFITQKSPIDGYVRISFLQDYNNLIDSNEKIMLSIVDGSVNEVVPYKPFKSNILTVNEEVTLRSNGSVQDELDLLTGKLTQRIGKIVLDGSQDMDADAQGVYIQVNDMKKVEDYRTIITCDKLPVFYHQWDLPNVENGITGHREGENEYPGQNWLYIKVNNSIDVDEVKEWLTQNPITVQYELSVESIKTVDLSIVDQNNNQQIGLNYFKDGYISIDTETGIIPKLDYKVTTDNYFEISVLEANKPYTLRYNGTINSMTIGGKTFNSPLNNSLVTIETVRDNTLLLNDGSVTDLMLIKGDVRNEDIKSFKGVTSIDGLEISISDNPNQPTFGKGGRK